MAKNLGIPMEKVYTNLDRYGNTSSASIPIALDEANRAGLIKDGDLILLVSFGAGLTWGATIIEWGD
jgi:3-oxoacyl-[acyl-carrier-protein] synthase-3